MLAHGAGLLGLTLAGWLVAAVVSVALILYSGRRRSAYLAAQAGQAALYQLAVATAQVVYLFWLGAGFLSLGGRIPGVDNWRFFDELPDPWLTAVQVLWGLSVLLWPLFTLGTVALAVRGAWRVAHDRRFWYPLVSGQIRRLAEGPRAAPPARPPVPSDTPPLGEDSDLPDATQQQGAPPGRPA